MSNGKKKGQLHELLAVEGDLKGEKEKIKEETKATFSKKPGHFMESVKTLKMFDEDRKNEEGIDRHEMTSTVPDKLTYNSKAFIRYWDVKLQKESANQQAKADVVVDGIVLLEEVPVTFLLGMEEEMKQLRKVYDAIPTLSPGYTWELDSQRGKHIYRTQYPVETHKTERTLQYRVVVQATKEHPAQVKEWNEDKPVGNYVTKTWSGMLSSAEKSAMLGKLDKIIRAVKKARQRANTQETQKLHVGKKIFDFIHDKDSSAVVQR